ncbi:rcc01693 family protein [Yoonia sp.]|uniref:rcc01693 family protein n=1 Tax=Yoonia sp. TaxID=2212373 RepID=UPI003A4E2417|nr:phage tail assembly chaperone [Loktanella sp.]
MTTLDWAGLLRAGLCTLRLHPAQFWALTPAELQLMLGAQAGPAPLTRAGLDALLLAFPDDVKGTDDARS